MTGFHVRPGLVWRPSTAGSRHNPLSPAGHAARSTSEDGAGRSVPGRTAPHLLSPLPFPAPAMPPGGRGYPRYPRTHGDRTAEPASGVGRDGGDVELHRAGDRVAVRARVHPVPSLEPDPHQVPAAPGAGRHRGRARPDPVHPAGWRAARGIGPRGRAAGADGGQRAGPGIGHAAGGDRRAGRVPPRAAIRAGCGLFPPHRRHAFRPGA